VRLVLRKGAHRKCRHVGAPDDDGPRRSQIGGHRCVVRRDHVLERDDAAVGGVTPLIGVDLHSHRHAAQRKRLAFCPYRVGGVGRSQRLIVHAAHYRVQLWVDRVHPAEHRLHRLAARRRRGQCVSR